MKYFTSSDSEAEEGGAVSGLAVEPAAAAEEGGAVSGLAVGAKVDKSQVTS